MSLSSPTNNNRGFSLMEILVSLGIVMFILMTLVAVLDQFQRKTLSAEGQAQFRLDLAVLERVLFDELNWSFPSIGNLNVRGTGNREFFEYFGGVPVGRIPAGLRTREFVLDLNNPNRTFEFVTEDKRAGDRRYFHPAQAYQFTLDVFNPSPLTYSGVNQARFFTTNFATHWTANGHFVFYAPAPVRDLSANATLRPVRFYSMRSSGDGTDLRPDLLSNQWKRRHPQLNTDINSLDQFLRLIPTLGGAMSQLVVVPVKVVRYRLVPDPRTRSGRLMKSIRQGGTYGQEILVGEGIDRLVFTRPDVTANRIEFQVNLKRSE